MATSPIGQVGLQGVHDGLARAQGAASRIVESGIAGNLDEVVAAVVDLKAAELQVAASAKIIQTDADTRGRLIDILA